MKALDFDKDGDLDIALAYEATNINGVEIWTNNGSGDFSYSNMKLEYSSSSLQFREFEVVDADGDGWQDIVLNSWNGNLFRTSNNGFGDVLLHNLVWKNNKGKYEKLTKEQKLPFSQVPAYLKSYNINGKLKFIGIKGNVDGTLLLTEINPVF
jgi:hypothetical protein